MTFETLVTKSYNMYQVIMFTIAVSLATVNSGEALAQATLLENLTYSQDISIFQLIDNISKMGEFTKEYIPNDHNLVFAQINHPS